MVILAVDYGEKRIGLAVSDPLGIAAHGLATLTSGGAEADAAAIAQTVREQEAEEVVVGLPVNMDGTEGQQAQICREFAERLTDILAVPVRLVDERLSSARAERVLGEAGLSYRKRKGKVDRLAAQFILEQYLQSRPHDPEGG